MVHEIRDKDNTLIIPEDFTFHKNISFIIEELVEYLGIMRQMIKNERNKSNKISFTDMTNSLLLFKTGLEREQFNILLSFLKEGDINIRNKSLYLGLYLNYDMGTTFLNN